MMQCSVYDKTTDKSETFCSVAAAKKLMKQLIKQGHEVSGIKTKVYADGTWEPCGEITLTGSNAVFMANTKQTKAGY